MALCFNPALCSEEDSAVLFSTSGGSPEGSTTPSSSSFHHDDSPVSSSSDQSNSKQDYNLTVKNLSYTVTFHTCFFRQIKPIPVLKSVTFTARSSEILAVVGPSGTGKSSLLRIISGRVKEKHFDPTSVFLNDCAVTNPSQLKKICGFVAQEDNLLPLLTVQETLMFSAEFRLKEMSARGKKDRVDSLMQELGLIHVCDSFVGDEEQRGISGGERKRLSIGLDMIHDPPILLLDEPTSGLDSSSALQVIELLSSMSKSKHRTIVLSIHQPSYRMFQYIPNFLILSNGSVIHNGSIESLETIIHRLGYTIPPQLNALEFSMEIMDSLQQIQDDLSSSSSSPNSQIHGVLHHHHHHHHDNDNEGCSSGLSSTAFEVAVLCTRFFKIIYRTKQLFLARTMQALVGGFGLGSVYLKVNNSGGVAERLGLFAFSLSFLLSSTVEALPIYLQERRVLMKEASRGAYKVSSYMIANTIVFLPFLFAVAILFAVPVYWLVGLNPSFAAFSFFIFSVWLIVLMASSLVLFLSAISPDFISGNSLISTVLGAFFLFSGYFIPKECIPKYWIFMYYVSLYRYPLDSLLINEYWSLRNECFSSSISVRNGTVPSSSCVLTGNDVLKSRGLMKDTRWINVGIMLSFFVFYRFLCWIILSRKVSRTTI